MDHPTLMLLVTLCSSGLCAELHSAGSEEFRLVGGASRCSGRLERKVLEKWEAEVEILLRWNLELADGVCKSLDCGSVVSIRRIKASQDQPDNPLILKSSDFYVHKIDFFNVTIICSDSIRLVNHLCSGRLEVKLNGSWSSVNEDDFDQQDAEVVCRELECGPPSGLQGALYGETKAPEWSREFLCEGHESALLKCRSSVQKYSGKAAGLTCSDPSDSGKIRLVGGDHRCAGTPNMKHMGEWKPVHGLQIDMKFAESVCKLLDCGSPITVRGRRPNSREVVWFLEKTCNGSNLMKCGKRITYNRDFSEIDCSDSIRLVNGANQCSGRLEVKSNNLWSIVCEDDFDQQDAEVVCRELECGAPSFLQGALYEETEAPEWRREFLCKGHESALLKCRSSQLTRRTCSSGKAVELTCSDPDHVMLVGGASRCSGELYLMHLKDWRPVVSTSPEWTMESSRVVCHQLNCGSVVSKTFKRGEEKEHAWKIKPDCMKSGSLWRECVVESSSPYRINITCSDSIRLVNRADQCSGRLEVKSNNLWSIVCEDDFDQQDAEVVCRELECGPPSALQGALYGETEAPEWSREFLCEGHESVLLDCKSSSQKFCSSGKAVDLTCSDSLESPNISVSSTSGVFKARNQGLQVFFGTSFSITCSSHHLYQGGIFQLIFNNSTTTLNNTLLTVNNTANFTCFEASYAHQGNYICVHHVHINSKNLTLKSQQLSLTVLVSVSLTEFIIRHVVVLLILVVSTSALYVYFKTKSRRMQEPKRNHPVDDGRARRLSERRLQKN